MAYKYDLDSTNQFKKDLKTIIKRGYDMSLIDCVVETLRKGEKLPEKHKDHAMGGKWKGHRNCHITPDWVLLYKIDKNVLVLALSRTGTHSDLRI